MDLIPRNTNIQEGKKERGVISIHAKQDKNKQVWRNSKECEGQQAGFCKILVFNMYIEIDKSWRSGRDNLFIVVYL